MKFISCLELNFKDYSKSIASMACMPQLESYKYAHFNTKLLKIGTKFQNMKKKKKI